MDRTHILQEIRGTIYLCPQHPCDGAAVIEVDEEDGKHEDNHDARPAQAQDEQVGARSQRPEPGRCNICWNIAIVNLRVQFLKMAHCEDDIWVPFPMNHCMKPVMIGYGENMTRRIK